MTVSVLTDYRLDHCPLLVELNDEIRHGKDRPFKSEESFEVEVSKIWRSPEGNVLMKVDELRKGKFVKIEKG